MSRSKAELLQLEKDDLIVWKNTIEPNYVKYYLTTKTLWSADPKLLEIAQSLYDETLGYKKPMVLTTSSGPIKQVTCPLLSFECHSHFLVEPKAQRYSQSGRQICHHRIRCKLPWSTRPTWRLYTKICCNHAYQVCSRPARRLQIPLRPRCWVRRWFCTLFLYSLYVLFMSLL